MKKLLPLLLLLTLYCDAVPTKAQKLKYLYPLGEKIYNSACKGRLEKKDFHSYNETLKYIHTHCSLEEIRYEEALAWYLWDKKFLHIPVKKIGEFHYTKKEKCPVCGMFVYKYPKWVTMARTAHGKELYFDGVKDMLKYFFAHPEKKIRLYAYDYYSKKIIELDDAWLVLGSDVYGPMGEEIIPFAQKNEAESFSLDHNGKKIVRLQQLNKRSLEMLDE